VKVGVLGAPSSRLASLSPASHTAEVIGNAYEWFKTTSKLAIAKIRNAARSLGYSLVETRVLTCSSFPQAETPPQLQPLLDERAVAAITSRAVRIQKDRISGNGIPFIRLGRSIRYRQADVEAWLDGQEVHDQRV